MTPQFLISLLTILCSSQLISSIRGASDNANPLGAYLVAVRHPDGLLGVLDEPDALERWHTHLLEQVCNTGVLDEPDALERWHTHLLEQVCNTSDPATSDRFPTAESRLIYSYSHVVSGFSAWLTPQELEVMAMHPWFVEAVPDKSYKLMSVDEPTPQLTGGPHHVRGGEGMITGFLYAGAVSGRVLFPPEAEGMPLPPAKWKGRCDYSEACSNRIIGFRSFLDTNRSQDYSEACRDQVIPGHEPCPTSGRAGVTTAKPAAIKSALVTTAHPVRLADAISGSGASYFVASAGEVNPTKAMDPGLVYDLTAVNFIPYLCGMNIGEDQMEKIVEQANSSCSETGVIAAKDLNYPSITIVMDDNVGQVDAKRTVTNVGEPAETYRVEATAPGVDVVVSPSTLVFTDLGQKLDFVVTVTREASTPAKAVIEGELRWVSDKHAVRSPLVVVVGETDASSVSYANVDDAASLES